VPGPSYSKQLQDIANDYRLSGQGWPATAMEIAKWAIQHGLWQPQPDYIVAKCAEELARAMGEEHIIDPQGRSVRAKHAARVWQDGKQLYLWDDIHTADRSFMAIAFQQRRQQIVGDCLQLKMDMESYNDNANPGAPIQLVFNFEQDLIELESMKVSA
jgi:hypothetical protein